MPCLNKSKEGAKLRNVLIGYKSLRLHIDLFERRLAKKRAKKPFFAFVARRNGQMQPGRSENG